MRSRSIRFRDCTGSLIRTRRIRSPVTSISCSSRRERGSHDRRNACSGWHPFSTDSILTRVPADQIPTGDELGDLKVVHIGRLIVLRTKLYVLLGYDGRVKFDRGGFHGKPAEMLALIRRGGGSYMYEHMVRPREARRSGEKPFR